MRIGVGILLLAVGLVLALAVDDRVGGVDLRLVGWILAGVGALALVLSALAFGPRRRGTVVQDRVVDDAGRVTERERRTRSDEL
jgi:Domain of unknown function (DUF6458)